MLRFVLPAALLLVAPSAVQAQYQTVCGPRDQIVAALDGKFGEYRIGGGVTPNAASIIEIFVSESGTWTVVETTPDGVSCIAAVGTDFEITTPVAGDPA